MGGAGEWLPCFMGSNCRGAFKGDATLRWKSNLEELIPLLFPWRVLIVEFRFGTLQVHMKNFITCRIFTSYFHGLVWLYVAHGNRNAKLLSNKANIYQIIMQAPTRFPFFLCSLTVLLFIPGVQITRVQQQYLKEVIITQRMKG